MPWQILRLVAPFYGPAAGAHTRERYRELLHAARHIGRLEGEGVNGLLKDTEADVGYVAGQEAWQAVRRDEEDGYLGNIDFAPLEAARLNAYNGASTRVADRLNGRVRPAGYYDRYET